MRVLVACEFSGIVRDAFRALGHDAWSCDLLPSEAGPKYHFEARVEHVLDSNWDLMIAHPPCTYMTNAGVRWFYGVNKEPILDRFVQCEHAVRFFNRLARAPIPRIALENPIPHKFARRGIGKYAQIIQPWMFGHGETKATCLWLKGLPPLVPTNIVAGREARVHKMPPGPDRWKERSRTLPGIAAAMAEQWGGNALEVAA